MSEMHELSGFEEDLARAVEDGIVRGGLPGAGDAVRRGRKRSLRARGGVAVLGVAAIGGALGVGSAFGTGGGAAAATAAAGSTATTGHSASVPTSATGAAAAGHGDGLLAAELWPGYAVEHWAPKLDNPPGKPVREVGSLVLLCGKGQGAPQIPMFPVTSVNQWGTAYDTPHHVDADQAVFTFADEAEASAFFADARTAGSGPACGTGPAAQVPVPGVSVDHGVSWLVTQEESAPGLPPAVAHIWVAQAGNRVTMLRTMQFGNDYKSTAGDAKQLAELRQALEK